MSSAEPVEVTAMNSMIVSLFDFKGQGKRRVSCKSGQRRRQMAASGGGWKARRSP